MEVIPELMANEKTENETREIESMVNTPVENEDSLVQNKEGADTGEEKTLNLKKKDGPVFPVPSWNAVPEQSLKRAPEENGAADSAPAGEGESGRTTAPQQDTAPQTDGLQQDTAPKAEIQHRRPMQASSRIQRRRPMQASRIQFRRPMPASRMQTLRTLIRSRTFSRR